jgi:hypothetical protein
MWSRACPGAFRRLSPHLLPPKRCDNCYFYCLTSSSSGNSESSNRAAATNARRPHALPGAPPRALIPTAQAPLTLLPHGQAAASAPPPPPQPMRCDAMWLSARLQHSPLSTLPPTPFDRTISSHCYPIDCGRSSSNSQPLCRHILDPAVRLPRMLAFLLSFHFTCLHLCFHNKCSNIFGCPTYFTTSSIISYFLPISSAQ